MGYYNSMQELIGNTPLVKLGYIQNNPDVNIFAKLELYNPSGSVKDRVGKYVVEDAEKKVCWVLRKKRKKFAVQSREQFLSNSLKI